MVQKIFTADGTETFLNESVKETYHSQTGAVEEAFKKYAYPCKIKELAKTGKITVLDICSGIMYNSAAIIDVALEENPNCEIEIFALEKDPEFIKKILEVDPPFKSYPLFRELIKNNLEKISQSRDLKNKTLKEKIKITLLIGDARERIKELEKDSFDAVFMDPFSPRTSPEMWSTEFFKELYRVIKENKILATFTCARLARDNMKAAGFSYDDGPIVGRRGPGTIAWKEEF